MKRHKNGGGNDYSIIQTASQGLPSIILLNRRKGDTFADTILFREGGKESRGDKEQDWDDTRATSGGWRNGGDRRMSSRGEIKKSPLLFPYSQGGGVANKGLRQQATRGDLFVGGRRGGLNRKRLKRSFNDAMLLLSASPFLSPTCFFF